MRYFVSMLESVEVEVPPGELGERIEGERAGELALLDGERTSGRVGEPRSARMRGGGRTRRGGVEGGVEGGGSAASKTRSNEVGNACT